MACLWPFLCVSAVLQGGDPVGDDPAEPVSVDSDGDGLTDAEEAEHRTDPTKVDTDGDGLTDLWEVRGFVGDDSEDGESLEPLHLYGASPLQRDVFVEIDWMASPDGDATENALIVYLAAADTYRFFRDSGSGIRIHFDLGRRIEEMIPPEVRSAEEALGVPDLAGFSNEPDPQKIILYQNRLPTRPSCQGRSSVRSLYGIYHDPSVFRPSRRNLFYYILLAESHQAADVTQSAATGLTSNFADEDSRRLGLQPTGVQVGVMFRRPTSMLPESRRRLHYAAILLHELGHGFGLGHGGANQDLTWNHVDRKPNYPSVMNRRFQFWGVDAVETVDGFVPRLGYSWGSFRPVHERRVFEPHGLGSRIPNDHMLDVLGVEHIETQNPDLRNNLDWDRDGEIDLLTYSLDLNGDDEVSDDELTDHNDWGKFLRDGFDGIGLNAFRCGGHGCGSSANVAGSELIRVPADVDGDGLTDLVLLRDRTCALYLATGETAWESSPRLVYEGAVDSWELRLDDQILVADLDGDGSDEIFFHRTRHAAVIKLLDDRLEVIWGGEPAPPDAADPEDPDATEGWTFARNDSVRAFDLVPEAGDELLVSQGDRAAVLGLRDSRLVTVWSAPRELRDWTEGEGPTLATGRKDRLGGGATFLLRSPTTLTEFDARVPGVPASRQDRNGIVPPTEAAAPGWRLSSLDCFVAVDVDNDGIDEFVVQRPRELGVITEREGALSLVWSDSDLVEEGGDEAVYTGQFVPGAGEEVVIHNGHALAALGWNRERQALEKIAEISGVLRDDQGREIWALDEGRIVDVRRVLPTDPVVLVVHVDARLIFVGLSDGVFRVLRLFDQSIAGWTLTPNDRFQIVDVDQDDEQELSIRKGELIGLVDLSPSPRLLFAARLQRETFELTPLPLFLRGDSNGDRSLDLSDVVVLLDFLFRGRQTINCPEAADADDNGDLDISDGIRILNFLFIAGPEPAAPGPWTAGIDPTPDSLPCTLVDRP